MAAQFLHVYVKLEPGKTKEELESVLNNAIDWFRYDQGLYVLYTTTNSGTWQARLNNLVKPNGSLFISPLKIEEYSGWMTNDFWAWLRKDGRAK